MTEEKEKYEVATGSDQAMAVGSPMNDNADVMSLMMDAQKYDMCLKIANSISKNKLMPKHLNGDENVCFQVVIQAFQWGMSPFDVAPKTYAIGQKLSYEAQLVNAVINKLAPTQDRLHFDWFGEWDKYIGSGLKAEYESTIGVRVWSTLKSENQPRVLEVKMNTVKIRNSTNWKNDPKQQICYVGIQRWARLFCPDVIMGVYTPDELQGDEPATKNITPPEKKPGQSSSDHLLDKLKGKGAQDNEATEEVVVEVVEDQPSVKDIIEAEIKSSKAPITYDDVVKYLKAVKNMKSDLSKICAINADWDKYIRNATSDLVKKAAEWSVAE